MWQSPFSFLIFIFKFLFPEAVYLFDYFSIIYQQNQEKYKVATADYLPNG